MTAVRDALREALALVLPVDCSGCRAGGHPVCPRCASAFGAEAVMRETGGLVVTSASVYADEVARVLGAFKDSGRLDAAPVLGVALRRAVEAALGGGASGVRGDVLAVTVPGSRAAFRRRGYEPVRVLARSGGIPVHRVLRLTRAVADQAALGAAERRANRSGALRASRDLSGSRVLLLDDVVTTGATLIDAARAVREAGGSVVGAATVAATPLRRAPVRGARGALPGRAGDSERP